MYINPADLPPFSNRESYSLSLDLYDDETGDLINISGTTGSGTLTSWAVATLNATDTYAGTLTIGPGQFSFTISTGKNIAAGDSITLTHDASNTMFGTVVSYVSATGALVVQIGCTAQFEIRQKAPYYQDDYRDQFYDGQGLYNSMPILRATVGAGITYPDLGKIQVYFSESDMRKLHLGTYIAALTIASSDGIDVRQVQVGQQPILFGGVTN